MEEQLEALRRLIAQNKHIVFFGGAGVSTESGISDFRSEDGCIGSITTSRRKFCLAIPIL